MKTHIPKIPSQQWIMLQQEIGCVEENVQAVHSKAIEVETLQT